jgi:integrase
MIRLGWCRTLINKRIDRLKRAIKWGVSQEMIPASIYEAIRTLPGLRRGRSAARESKPVKPVPLERVIATLPLLPSHVRVMVELMMHTGMRPNEVCSMSLNSIDRSGHIWVYKPNHHKTTHQGKERVIPLGPKARTVLAEFLAGRPIEPGSPIFSPTKAREERFTAMRKKRKSKVPPSQQSRRKTSPKRLPAERYTPLAICHASFRGLSSNIEFVIEGPAFISEVVCL